MTAARVAIGQLREPEATQRPDIVAIPLLATHLFQDRPISISARHAVLARDVRTELGGQPVIVKQRVVAIEETTTSACDTCAAPLVESVRGRIHNRSGVSGGSGDGAPGARLDPRQERDPVRRGYPWYRSDPGLVPLPARLH